MTDFPQPDLADDARGSARDRSSSETSRTGRICPRSVSKATLRSAKFEEGCCMVSVSASAIGCSSILALQLADRARRAATSPIRLYAKTVRKIASPGKTASHQMKRAAGAGAWLSISPQLGSSTRPEAEEAQRRSRSRIADATPKLALTSTGVSAVGQHVPEEDRPQRQPRRHRRLHEVLVAQLEELGADEARVARPARSGR